MKTTLSRQERSLVTAAARAQKRAYCPYSGYRVGAALLDARGRVFPGCNVENASYSATTCAERVALGAAVAAGSRRFRAIAIVTSGKDLASPCGVCRQALSEFSPDLVILISDGARRFERTTLAELLPRQFRCHQVLGRDVRS
ncbi:MAG: cytidine deaminase [Planctomycetota bacterium]